MKKMNKAKKTVLFMVCLMLALLPGLSVCAAESGMELSSLSAWLSFDEAALNRTQTGDGFALFYTDGDGMDTTILTDSEGRVTALTLAAGNVSASLLTDAAYLNALMSGNVTETDRSAVNCLMKGMALYCAFGGAAQSMETMTAAVFALFAGDRTVDMDAWRIRAYISEEAGAVVLTVRPLEAAQ